MLRIGREGSERLAADRFRIANRLPDTSSKHAMPQHTSEGKTPIRTSGAQPDSLLRMLFCGMERHLFRRRTGYLSEIYF